MLALPVAGIMSYERGEEVAVKYQKLQSKVMELGGSIDAPFMTLAFLSLVVIPDVKIGEKGLFSFSKFDWI